MKDFNQKDIDENMEEKVGEKFDSFDSYTEDDAHKVMDILKKISEDKLVKFDTAVMAVPQFDTAKLKALRPEESTAAWSFRWLQNLPNVKVVLSGMSAFDQMADTLFNIHKLIRDIPRIGGV